jgi:AcrR family transcriptional regulator
MARARLDPQARRAQLIDIAFGLLEDGGIDTLSVEDVADAAGVSRSLVYTYFGDRDGLVAEVYLRVLAELGHAFTAPLPANQVELAQLIAECLAFAGAHPAAWQLLATDSVRRHELVVDARVARVDQLTGNRMDGSSARLLADAALGLLEAGVWHWVDRSDLSERQAADLLAEILWTGLAGVRASKT